MSKHLFLILLLTLVSSVTNLAQNSIYQNKKYPVEQRVKDLLKRMTLEEKVGQMCQYVGPDHMKISERNLTKEEMLKRESQAYYPGLHSTDVEALVEKGMIGSLINVFTAEEANHLQELALKSRMKIPVLIARGGVHGDGQAVGTTIYPTAISIASAWDSSLVYRITKETATEMRATGCAWNFTPNLDVSRDPRWGRVGETYGEDPFLVSVLGVQVIKALQEPEGGNAINMLACAKHYVGGSQSVNGTNAAPVFLDERSLREVFLPPYQAAINAGLATIMPQHNELNGIPCHSNELLLDEIARKEFCFSGFYVSDWMDVQYLDTEHHVAENMKEACYQTIMAGLDVHMHGPGFFEPVIELVKDGRISEKRIDASVKRILEAKFKLGLFDQPIVELKGVDKTLFNIEHQKTALEAARKSIVLLKNDKNFLPIQKGRYKKILVTGPNANNQSITGDWSAKQPEENIITVLEGLKQADQDCEFVYFDTGLNPRDVKDTHVKAAKEKAMEADLVIAVVGENSFRWDWNRKTCGESSDRAEIDLFGLQEELVEALHQSGKPVVVVLVNGRPQAVEWISKNVSALIEAWEPGCKGGQALAEIIYGDVNPSGKITMTFPRSSSHLLNYYSFKPTHNWKPYLDANQTPLFPFGYGLSYSNFSYSNLKVDKQRINTGGSLTASIDVKNISQKAGDEIVQLYLRDKVSSVTRPVKELKGFKRISLKAGEEQTVSFEITPEMLKFYDKKMKMVIEPGEFVVMIGKSSDDKELNTISFFVDN